MKINEIFYSLQGEGFFTGTPATFVRFAGCNMKCDFCDTDHTPFTEMTEDEITSIVAEKPSRHVVLTGGEPTLQLTATLLRKLHELGKYIQIETNGTINPDSEVLSMIDWVTCSPKSDRRPAIARIDELKLVFSADNIASDAPDHLYYNEAFSSAKCIKCLQPCDTKDAQQNRRNLEGAIDFVKAHPDWRLSLQTHKQLNIP